MVLPVRIELTTSPLPRECSTTELRQRKRAAWPGPRNAAETATRGRGVQGLRATAMGMPECAVECGMDERNDRLSVRGGPRPARAERLAEALRANLKRRKAQARGRADHGAGKNQPNQPKSDNRDR